MISVMGLKCKAVERQHARKCNIVCFYLLLRTLTEEEKLATNIDMSLLFSEAMLITAVFLFRTLAVWGLQ